MEQGLVLSESVVFPSGSSMMTALVVALLSGLLIYVIAARPKLFFGLRGGSRQDRTLGMFLAVLACTAVLIAPLLLALAEGDAFAAIPLLGIRLLQAVVLDNGFVDFIGGTPQGLLARVYYVLVGLGYILLPVLAAFNVYELFAQRFSSLRMWKTVRLDVKRKNVYLFNCFSLISYRLAKDALQKDPDAIVIYGAMSKLDRDTWSTEISDLDPDRTIYLETSYPETAWRLCLAFAFSRLYCFAISGEASQDIADTCNAMGLMRGIESLDAAGKAKICKAFLGPGSDNARSRVRLFSTCDSLDDELVLDAANGDAQVLAPHIDPAMISEPLQLTVLNEATMAMFDLLQEAPLLDVLGMPEPGENGLRPAMPMTLNALVIGEGPFAEEVLKGILWCGQLYNVRLEVEVVSPQAQTFCDRLFARCPDLRMQDCFSLKFTEMGTHSPDFEEKCLASYMEARNLYVVSAIEDDALSFEIAMRVRRYFIGRRSGSRVDVRHSPLIACLIRSEVTSSLISSQFDEDIPSYGIVTFGCSTQLFGYENVLNSRLERAGQRASDLYDVVYKAIDGRLFASEEVNVAALRDCVQSALEKGKLLDAKSDNRPFGIACARQIVHYSNLAQALHSRYKSWSIATSELSDEAIVSLGTAEHDRWTMFYRTHGFTFLSPEEQEAYSRELCGKNTRHKIEPLRKHSLMCPNDDIWFHYLHAKAGFSYIDRGVLPEGAVCLDVVAVDSKGEPVEGISLQLLDERYRVLDEWVSESLPHRVDKLSPGAYILHPASAMPGCECAADMAVEVGKEVNPTAGQIESVLIRVEGRVLVNPVVYDWAFAMVAPVLIID